MTPTPRVQATKETQIVNTKPSTPRVQTKSMKELSPQKIKLCSHIHEAITNRARLPQRYNRQLCQQEQREHVQLIHDHNTRKYLNYQQLIHDPKHSKLWLKLSANEFGRLAQGVGG
jgi:hypothetical protein